MDFPKFELGPHSHGRLYATPRDPSIYSSHIQKLIEQCVRSVFQLPCYAIRSRARHGRMSLARQIAMYLAHVAFSLSLTQTGRLFGRDRTTVAHACGVVEDLRDDPAIDKALTVLASILTASTPSTGGATDTMRSILPHEAQQHTAKK